MRNGASMSTCAAVDDAKCQRTTRRHLSTFTPFILSAFKKYAAQALFSAPYLIGTILVQNVSGRGATLRGSLAACTPVEHALSWPLLMDKQKFTIFKTGHTAYPWGKIELF